jgi:hypothetical protein
MIARYIFFLLTVNVFFGILNLILYPLCYVFRSFIRGHKNLWIVRFFWYFLNDGGYYGDEHFQRKFKKSDSPWHLFLLSYKANIRNPTQNLYYSLPNYSGSKTLVKSTTYCTNRPTLKGEYWRTVKYKHEDDSYADKHGAYIDYKMSIFGRQWYVFLMEGKKFFRYSRTFIWHFKLMKKIFIHESKFGYEDNWSIQFRFGVREANSKSIKEYNEYLNLLKKD